MSNLVERFYDFDEICRRADCVQVAKDIGLEVKEDRCKATWRGGENETSVSLSQSGWHDFGTGESGSVIELVSRVRFGDDLQQAQQYLGDTLGMSPALSLEVERVGRVEKLIEAGYKLTKSYEYKDLDGNVAHVTERWEHPTKKKEFVQRAATGKYSIKNIKTFLYRLPEWINSEFVAICEGEKDVDTLFNLGFPATTNASGAGRWEARYNEWIKGKNIIIFADNDTAGKSRLNFLLWELSDVIGQVKGIVFRDEKDGFDVTDYVEKYGEKKLINLINAAPMVDKSAIREPNEDYHALQVAKEANKFDLRNYIVYNDNGEQKKKPRQINDIVRDIHSRFIGFPAKVGDKLFDHDRNTQRVETLDDTQDLFAWMARKSKRLIDYNGKMAGAVSRQETFAALRQVARRYESISYVPDYPRQSNVYYAHPQIPAASPTREYFERFVEFFSPASNAYRILLKTFFAAPLYYVYGQPRPVWIIDSEDGVGTGKTTIAEQCAALYNTEPIKTHKTELKNSYGDIMKRIVSSSGRMKRIFLVDNVTGNFMCQEFADMITARSLSGRPAYGKGEESRPNNLTYVITANTATIDTDIAHRAYFVFVKRAKMSPSWLRELNDYINNYRYHIIADIIDTLKNSEPFDVTEPGTRFPDFESRVLMANCGDFDEYNETIKSLYKARAESNIEEEYAAVISDTIRCELASLAIDPSLPVFIRSQVIDEWFRGATFYRGDIKQLIRNLAKTGKIPEIDKKISIYPHNGKGRRRGVMWCYSEGISPCVIGIKGNKEIGRILD